MECVSEEGATLCWGHGAGGDRRGLGLGSGGGGTLLFLEGVLAAAQSGDHAVAELLVQADVDDWVVDGGALGKEGWEGHENRAEIGSWMNSL